MAKIKKDSNGKIIGGLKTKTPAKKSAGKKTPAKKPGKKKQLSHEEEDENDMMSAATVDMNNLRKGEQAWERGESVPAEKFEITQE